MEEVMSLSPEEIFQRHQRQVHLDFHTSPLIPGVAGEFDATAFARTLARARVNSVTVFAKCHHGMCYYPAKTGTPHPALGKRDLLGEQIEALHREGIRAPIYTTIAWDEDAAARFPAWRQMLPNGVFADSERPPPSRRIRAHGNSSIFSTPSTRITSRRSCAKSARATARKWTGSSWISSPFIPTPAGANRACASARPTASPPTTPRRRRVSRRRRRGPSRGGSRSCCRDAAPAGATIYYNADNDISVDGSTGPRARYPQMTHAEIESLPSGPWGYHHFPRVARALAHWGKPWLGMTGRFQRSWGDFGGIKPLAALEYECFRTQALGGANSVGDQLPPRGTLDADAYDLIGRVYEQCEGAEAFYAGSRAIPQFGNVSSRYPGLDTAQTAKSDEGAMLMAQEVHFDVAMIDERADLSRFELVQLTDHVVVTPLLEGKLRAYYEAGGKLLLSYRAGFRSAGQVGAGLPAPVDVAQAGGQIPHLLARAARDGASRREHGPGVLHAGSGSAGGGGGAGGRGPGAAVFPADGRGVFLAFADAAHGRAGHAPGGDRGRAVRVLRGPDLL